MKGNPRIPRSTVSLTPWLFMKILCFSLQYLLAALAVVALFFARVDAALSVLDLPSVRLVFGLFLIATGASTAATAKWKAEALTWNDARSQSYELNNRDLDHDTWAKGVVMQGVVAMVLGFAAAVTAVGVWDHLWEKLLLFHSRWAGAFLLAILIGPTFLGSYVRSVLCVFAQFGFLHSKDR